MLSVPLACGPPPRLEVEREKKFPEGSLPEPRRVVGRARFVDEERERDAGLRPEGGRVFAAAQPDGRDACPGIVDLLLMVAQPGDVLAAEHSAVMS